MERAVSPRPEVRIWILALLVLSSLGCASKPIATPTTSSNDSDISAKLDREIERLFQQSDSPGLAVGVAKVTRLARELVLGSE